MNTTEQPSKPMSFIRLRDVVGRTGLGRTSIYERVKKGEFPLPIKLGARTTVWTASAIDEWIHAQLAKANAAQTSRSAG